MMRLLPYIVIFSVVFSISAQDRSEHAPGTHLAFTACPIARSTGPDTDVCFLAEYQGVRYVLNNPPDWGKPELGHQVLVEAQIVEGALQCGALPLQGRVSVLAELDSNCNQILPFDGSVVGQAGGIFNSGTPQQRKEALELARRAEQDPSLSVQPANPETPPPEPPAAPFQPQRLIIYFPFNSDRGSGPDMLEVVKLVQYANAARAPISIVSYQGETLLSSGDRVTERTSIAQQRGEKMQDILQGLGLTAEITLRWVDQPLSGDGVADWRNRRVELVVEL